MGLMQTTPDKWAELRLRYDLGTDPYDPHDNITAGAACLREMHDRYGEPGLLAAYSAGPDRYADLYATGRPLPSKTSSYSAVVASLVDVSIGNEANFAASATLPGIFLTVCSAWEWRLRVATSVIRCAKDLLSASDTVQMGTAL